jgi:Arc/MetJ-type ribon-helix-helix transcriptional regulator
MAAKKKKADAWETEPKRDKFDDFQTDDEWVVPSVDEEGHGCREYVQIPPKIARKLEELVQSGVLPYKIKSDILRHAIYRHIYWLMSKRHTGKVNHILLAMEASILVTREEYIKAKYRTLVESMRDRLTDHMKQGNLGDATRLYMHVRAMVDKSNDSIWRTKILSELGDLYFELRGKYEATGEVIPFTAPTHLRNTTPGANLRPVRPIARPAPPDEEPIEEAEDTGDAE